jgi:hypothetical protein
MVTPAIMNSPKKIARMAGVLYLAYSAIVSESAKKDMNED